MTDTTLYDNFSEGSSKASKKVTCLGMTFDSEEERRNYFIEKLLEKLQDPEFRKIEGFPIGSDEDILHLSDPPYYTACPNPWIADFVNEWESEKPEKPADHKYHREPFAADVSEGKNDPIYNAHSYHTKVPHKAIMRYILHYTEPGDIVFDGFCGTGMTGVAAQMCGDRKTVESLGYQVKADGTIMQQETGEDGKTRWVPFSKLGVRRAVLNDLSPAATFIAYNYNTPVDVKAFEKEAKRILKEVEEECGWMYETKHTDGRMGKMIYTVWSDVFVCSECANEIVFWDVAAAKETSEVKEDFLCPHCSSKLAKRNIERVWVTKYDSITKETVKQAKQIPVMVNYSVDGKRFEKEADEFDLALIEKIENCEIPHWFPTAKIQQGDKSSEPLRIGINNVNHIYTKRNLWVLGSLWEKIVVDVYDPLLKRNLLNFLTACQINLDKRYAFRENRKGGIIKGTMYIPSFSQENNVFSGIQNKYSRYISFISEKNKFHLFSWIVTNSSSSSMNSLQDTSADYLFIDPPFGSNLHYSELSYLWESWLQVWTNNKFEAIENKTQEKGLNEYRQLMTVCFKEAYRILKPGRWMTVEFSNTKASVWNSIQTALTEAGFIIANVSALDKKQGSYNAVTNTTSVKQDLVISAYKPNGGFEERFQKEAKTEAGVWDFVRTHLEYLPVTKYQGALLQLIPERDPRILFDQMVAYYVRKGYPVPISSQEFQVGLGQRFIERDGMYFLPEQAAEYDRKKLTSGQLIQTKLFVSDEASAIQWLRHLLKVKPQTFQDINPQFMQELGGWSKNEEQLELSVLLDQNFLSYDGKGEVPSQIHGYLSTNWPEMRNLQKNDPALVAKAKDRWYVPDPNKAGDLEKLREKSLLKEFDEYRQSTKKLKVFRMEAVRAGFKKAWQERDYSTIIKVADLIPNNVLEEDPKLLMWYDQAVTRVGGE
jgi:DNA modification methylase/DNA-directed RNA polymerase subunit RPC12/RpoP